MVLGLAICNIINCVSVLFYGSINCFVWSLASGTRGTLRVTFRRSPRSPHRQIIVLNNVIWYESIDT